MLVRVRVSVTSFPSSLKVCAAAIGPESRSPRPTHSSVCELCEDTTRDAHSVNPALDAARDAHSVNPVLDAARDARSLNPALDAARDARSLNPARLISAGRAPSRSP